jgi:acyl-CoA thioesterase II
VPQSIDELVSLLDLETIEDGLYRGRQPETALQRVFGGQVAGQALVAAVRTVEPDREVHSLHAYFLRPGDTSVPIVYDVERTRDGRSFSTRRVVARQHGRLIFSMTASFQVPEPGLEHQDPMPGVTPPEDCPELGDVLSGLTGRPREDWDREWAALDVRYAGDSRAGGVLHDPDHPALARVWLRAAGKLADDPWLHASVLAYASDLTLLSASVVPHGVFIGDPRLQPASLDHAMWFHRGFRADEWLLYDQVSPSAGGGRGFATGRLFTADGRLVASVVQEGLVRLVR